MKKEIIHYKNPFANMIIAPKDIDEILTPAIKKASRVSIKITKMTLNDIRRLNARKIEILGNYVIERLNKICYTTPFILDLHPFYRELAMVLIDIDRFKISLARIKRSVEIIGKIKREHLRRLRYASTRNEIVNIRRAFLGRLASVLEEVEDNLRELRRAQLQLKRLPDINPEIDTIVIAGPPNVGKSSFVKCVSTAKPEVREYPFTTKSLILGHIILDNEIYIQVIDTPGLLDRPLSRRNKIELQAILALKYLARVIIFLLDPSETCGYPLNEQINVYRDVKIHFKEIPIIPVLNKIDITTENKINKAIEELGEKALKISVLKKINIVDVLTKAFSYLSIPSYYIEKYLSGFN